MAENKDFSHLPLPLLYIEENQSYAGLIRLLNEPTVIVIIEHIMASI